METLTMALLGLVVLAGTAFVLLQIIQRQRRLQAELDRLEKLTAEAAMTAEAALDQVDERIERMNQLVALLEQKVKRDVAAATGADAAVADGEAAGSRRGRSRRKKAEAASEEASARKEEPAARKEGQTRKRGRPRKKEAAAHTAGGDERPAAHAEAGAEATAAAGVQEAAAAAGAGAGATEAVAGPEVRTPQWERLDPPGKGGAGQAPGGGAGQLPGGGAAGSVQPRAGADQAAGGRLHPKVQAVVELAKQGKTPLEIAEELGIPRGEVQLILSVRRHTA